MASKPVPDSLNDEFLFAALMESTADSIYFKDRDCRLLRVSRKMAKDLGFADPADLVGKTDIDLFGETFGQGTRRRPQDHGHGPAHHRHDREPQMGGGRTNWTLTTKLPLHDDSGAVMGLVGITREINEIRQTEVALQHLATHDTLTDLPNRFLLVDRLGQLLTSAGRSDTAFAVLFMDIDRFKEVNDSHGHEAGDQLFSTLPAQRLTKSVRRSDTVARIGGDEFVVVLERVHQVGEADAVADKIRLALAAPYTSEEPRGEGDREHRHQLLPGERRDADTLLRAADYAMYLAKRQGGNRHLTCLPGLPRPGEVLERE
jgi:diguanylate cyclase (GGDEF)-like protein/PAS domain S-box-containing protein